MSKTVVITGTSSGIGRSTAHHFARMGWNVAATMRTTTKAGDFGDIPNISVYSLDVRDDKSVQKAIESVYDDFGSIDVLVNNAGYAALGIFESLSMQTCKDQFETNFFGPLRTIKAVLPIMRKQKNGSIINVSSYTAAVSLPLTTLYGASKRALDGFTNSLRLETENLGIKISTIVPGYTKTNLTDAKNMAGFLQNSHESYTEFMAKVKGKMNQVPGLSEPTVVAESIYKVAISENPLPRYAAAQDSEMMLSLQRQKTDEEIEQFIKQTMIG